MQSHLCYDDLSMLTYLMPPHKLFSIESDGPSLSLYHSEFSPKHASKTCLLLSFCTLHKAFQIQILGSSKALVVMSLVMLSLTIHPVTCQPPYLCHVTNCHIYLYNYSWFWTKMHHLFSFVKVINWYHVHLIFLLCLANVKNTFAPRRYQFLRDSHFYGR